MPRTKKCILTIAGSDSSGGAGIQADIKTISALDCYAASVITALTAQNTLGVQSVQGISADFVSSQLQSVFSDLTIDAVKIGMLFDETIVNIVAEALIQFKPPIIVLDPVMMSKNGCALISPNTIKTLKEKLFPLVSLITPNAVETGNLVGRKINSKSKQEKAAIELGTRYQVNVLVKGGHIISEQSADVLFNYAEQNCHWFYADRIHTNNTHGTGCSLASAIASYFAKGSPAQQAVARAKQYLTAAIQAAADMQIGKGSGPVDHFYFFGKTTYDI